MEGVGARFGRSSSRYGPATVFTGPVRKWRKKWVPVPPSSSNHQHHSAANGAGNGTNSSSHLMLFKWTPITPSQNKEGNGNNHNNNNYGTTDSKVSPEDDAGSAEEPPRRKFKYIPIDVLEELKNESSEQIEDEAKVNDIDENAEELTSKSDGYDGKPDINDVPTDETEDPKKSPVERQDLNESTLELSLGFKVEAEDVQAKEDQLE
ncbi:B-cell CLL/lymphoma 7 protein family member B [Striga asiatica]|uniref:B-cell CLL/lymphoma 7 protein family member B n=1 Tax=Striga asiatica TaxID=4170 RepID=A0A5A7R6I9_STRAF|nr:B-cell CLL/lymphoma 7 protein family member B [Striga asiatica]